MAQKPKPRVGLYQGGYVPKLNIPKQTAAGRRATASRAKATSARQEKTMASRASMTRAAAPSPTRARAAASARMAAQAGSKSAAAPATSRKRVTVKSGDTLSSIAKREGVSLAALKQANKGRAVLNRIYSGSKVVIPGKKK